MIEKFLMIFAEKCCGVMGTGAGIANGHTMIGTRPTRDIWSYIVSNIMSMVAKMSRVT